MSMTNGLGLDYDLNQDTCYKQGDVRDVLRENLVRENKVPKFRPFLNIAAMDLSSSLIITVPLMVEIQHFKFLINTATIFSDKTVYMMNTRVYLPPCNESTSSMWESCILMMQMWLDYSNSSSSVMISIKYLSSSAHFLSTSKNYAIRWLSI